MTDLERVRELAKETREFANSPEMARRRNLWTAHNSLSFTRPPIYTRSVPFGEFPESREWDITLKDLETTGGDPTAIIRWVDIVRGELDQRYGKS